MGEEKGGVVKVESVASGQRVVKELVEEGVQGEDEVGHE